MTPRPAGQRAFVALVVALMSSVAMGIDMMLPAFPAMRREFGMPADSTAVAWTVTVYFLAMAVGPWAYGPASDRYGRRRPLMIGLGVYTVGAALAAAAPTWPLLLVARVVWGLGAAGPRSLTVAIVRDRYEGPAMARLMSLTNAVFLLVPIAAPAVGAGLVAVFPWRAVFVVPALAGAGLLLWCRWLPETMPAEHRRPFTAAAVGRAAREVLTHRVTVALLVAMVALYGLLLAYLGGSEVIVEAYGAGRWYPLFFAVIAVVMAVASVANARLVGHFGVRRLTRATAVFGVVAGGVLVAVGRLDGGLPPLVLFTLALAPALAVMQVQTPNTNTLVMTPLPHVAGTASTIISTVTAAGGSLLGSLAAGSFDGTVRPFSLYILGFLGAAGLLVWWATAE